MDKTTQLEQRVADLEKQLELLKNSNTIPDKIEASLMGRGFLKISDPEQPDDYSSNEGFVLDSYAAIPVRYVRILNINGQRLWIPVYTYSELGP